MPIRIPLLLSTLALAVACSTILLIDRASAMSRSDSTVPGIVDIFTSLGNTAEAAGTGIILTPNGEILTNNHVIRGAKTIDVVVLDTGKHYTGTVVGYSLANDVAVVQIHKASKLTVATLGSSSYVKAGDAVTGRGNAGGRGGAPSVAKGTVVALNRSLQVGDDPYGTESLHGLIESTAPIQAGDSGGPLTNAQGKVIGMDTATSSTLERRSGDVRSFAIPINHARTIAARIVAGRKSPTIHVGKTAFIGIFVQQQTTFFGDSAPGVVIQRVASGSPAARVGLVRNDVITRFAGKPINSTKALIALIVSRYPGQMVPIAWFDEVGKSHHARLKLTAGTPQ